MKKENKIVSIDTKKYSTVIKAILDEYPDCLVKINKRTEHRDITEWCRNKIFLSIIDFAIIRNNEDILSFHDHPSETFASMSLLPLLEDLSKKKILRYKILT